ncbi:MAG: hypothetical protein HRT57_07390 [Crocinitomicaceae bacterium]|nr:hypothetical protein [Crocinitomicaceae bacterium]
MKMELAVGIALATGLTIAMIGCEKKEIKTDVINAPSDFTLVTDSIQVDSTIENREIIAFATKALFDQKSISGATDLKLTRQFLLDQISIEDFNENTLVKIEYEGWGKDKQHSIGVYLLDSNLIILSKGMIPGAQNRMPELKIEDWNKDKKLELKVTLESPISVPDVVSTVETIYSFKEEDGLKLIFELEKEYRNCSAVMDTKWNYTSRSYSFTSAKKIKVKEANYLIDCEQFDRMGSVVKLKRISTEEYNIELP